MLGTAAHLLASTCLKTSTSPGAYLYRTICVSRISGIEEFFLPPGAVCGEQFIPFEVDRSMTQAVEQFIVEVRQSMEEHGCKTLHVEEFLDLTWIHQDMGGTADAYFLGFDDWVYLYDYKHGQSLSVEVGDNEQLKIYSIGALYRYPDATGVCMSIIQPRKDHVDGFIRSVVYTREELKIFVRSLRKACKAISAPYPKLIPGDWCDYCPAEFICPAFNRR
jgi:hypothetical protein